MAFASHGGCGTKSTEPDAGWDNVSERPYWDADVGSFNGSRRRWQ